MAPNQNQNSQPDLMFVLTTPIFVPTTDNPNLEDPRIKQERMNKFAEMPRQQKYKLVSLETSQKIQAIGQKYGFELLRLANITRLIREYYFGEARLEDFPKEIEKRMGVSLFTAQEIARHIKSEIIDWDPWAEYVARLPKITVREMIEKRPKLADIEITAGYIELRNSEDLEDPTIKNWIRDYVAHLGYERHSQMQRTQYLFHSENGRNLNSPDREKLGIILKSFDENIPLPVDEENNEIIFERIAEKATTEPAKTALRPSSLPTGGQDYQEKGVGDAYRHPAPAPNTKVAYTRPLPEEQKTIQPQESFVKPYTPRPRPRLIPPIAQPEENIHPNLVTLPNRRISPEIDKHFTPPENPDLPGIKIHSITEHNKPKPTSTIPPRPTVQHPVPPITSVETRPQHRIINPFEPRIVEPKLDGNIVDLSDK